MGYPSVAKESIRLGPVFAGRKSVPTANCSPVSPFLRCVVTKPSRMKFIRSAGCRVGHFPWWRHQMKTFSASLALCAGKSPVPGEFSAQRPVTRSFDVLFDLRLDKRLSKQSWGWWFETLSRPLWRHSNASVRSYGLVYLRTVEYDQSCVRILSETIYTILPRTWILNLFCF